MAGLGKSGEELFGSFQFILEVEGITKNEARSVVGGFSKVAGMDSKTEVIEYRHGNSPHVHKKPGRTNYSNITLERGFSGSDDLYVWRRQIENGSVTRRSGSVVAMDHDGVTEVWRYNFFGAWPSEWEAPDFDAGGSQMAIEKITLTIERGEYKRGG